jgi:hypothetical protein
LDDHQHLECGHYDAEPVALAAVATRVLKKEFATIAACFDRNAHTEGLMALKSGVVNWLETNRFKVYGALNNVWMNDEGFVLLDLELRHEQPSSLDQLLATLRRGKAAPSKPA